MKIIKHHVIHFSVKKMPNAYHEMLPSQSAQTVVLGSQVLHFDSM